MSDTNITTAVETQVSDTNITTAVETQVSELSELAHDVSENRKAAAVATGSRYGAYQRYSASLTQSFNFAWYDVKEDDGTPEAEAVKKERAAFYAELVATSPNMLVDTKRKAWFDIRKAARGPKAGDAKANEKRAIRKFLVEELAKIAKRYMKSEKEVDAIKDEVAQVQVLETGALLIQAARRMGLPVEQYERDGDEE